MLTYSTVGESPAIPGCIPGISPLEGLVHFNFGE